MRSGILYAAVCMTLASLAHGQHTVTEYKTITTTMYREHEAAPTATRGIDNGGLTDIAGPAPQPTDAEPPKDGPLVKEPPPPMNEPPKDAPNEPPMPNEPPKNEPPKDEPPKGPNEPPKNEPPKDGPPPPNGKEIEPPKGGSLVDLNPTKKDNGLKPTGALPIGNKVNPSAGASASKSGAATDFTFSPITLAPESSQGQLGTSLRELTASHKPTGSSASAHDNGAVGIYSMSFATIAGMTLMGAVALIQL